jgi:sulfur-oxidizing protein SoxY
MPLSRRTAFALPLLALAAPLVLAGPAQADAWDELKPAVVGDRAILPGEGIVTLITPYRAEDDRKVPVEVKAAFADGRTVKAITVVIDENPMPVSAVVSLAQPRAAMTFEAKMRLNGPSKVRAIVEASDGALYMAEAPVKTSGLGACASPPVTDPKIAEKTLGNMDAAMLPSGTSEAGHPVRRAQLDILHPNLTGLQMDQITLLYIPARYVSDVEVKQGGQTVLTIKGGISLSENPSMRFDWRDTGGEPLAVTITDTAGAVFRKTFPVGPGA